MTVSDQIIQVLNVLCAKFGIVIDWTSENVIPYLSVLGDKLVAWEIWSSVAWMGIMVALSIAGIIGAKSLNSSLKRSMDDIDYTICLTLIIIAAAVLCLVTIIVLGTQIMDIIKCVTFPEMHIFEYIKSLIDSGS